MLNSSRAVVHLLKICRRFVAFLMRISSDMERLLPQTPRGAGVTVTRESRAGPVGRGQVSERWPGSESGVWAKPSVAGLEVKPSGVPGDASDCGFCLGFDEGRVGVPFAAGGVVSSASGTRAGTLMPA